MPFRVAYDYSRDGILRSIEASLHRLGLDRIDLALVHDIGRRIHCEAHAGHWDRLVNGGFDALVSLREQGVIGEHSVLVSTKWSCASTRSTPSSWTCCSSPIATRSSNERRSTRYFRSSLCRRHPLNPPLKTGAGR
ncbi:aldo/keto reductase [Sphingobium sp. Leaf26]|uniref:aldo/keto reductase n=1 Tax=Sphingobium sp. Leaf26 TaxID=1735693 RepID=UPI0009E90215